MPLGPSHPLPVGPPQSARLPATTWSRQGGPGPPSPHLYTHQPGPAQEKEASPPSPAPHPTAAQTPQARATPPGSPPSQGRAYLSDTAGVVLGLGGGPEQARRHRGRPQLQDPTEVRGVGGGSSGGGGRRRVGLLALGGQAELLGSPGEGTGGEGRGGRRGEGRGREERRVRVLRAVLPPAPP